MRIVVCLKPVLDPDTVNAYAVAGRLEVDPRRGSLVRGGIPLLMNGYDEQALEAALRLRDAGAEASIAVLTLGDEEALPLLRRVLAMGADEAVLLVDPAFQRNDGLATAFVLRKTLEKLGGADLVLCGRQGSDEDRGIVGPALAQLLGLPFVSVARAIELVDRGTLRVTRVLPDGEQVVEVGLPALVTVSNELGQPRFPTARGMLEARRKPLRQWSAADLGLTSAPLMMQGPHVRQVGLTVVELIGACQFVPGGRVEEQATALARLLRQEGLI